MFSPPKTPFRLPPAVILLGVTLLLIAFGAFLINSRLNDTRDPLNPTPLPTIIMRALATPIVETSIAMPETDVPSLRKTAKPTLNYVLSFPPKVTPFPTFDPSFVPTIAPRADWVTYTDDLEGFSVRYPQGWLVHELPLEIRQTSPGYTTTIGNYRGDEPTLIDIKGDFPPQLFKIDLGIDRPGTSGLPIPPDQSLQEWANVNKRLVGGDIQWLEEGYISIAGTQGYRFVWDNQFGLRGVGVVVPKDERMFSFGYILSAEHPELMEAAEQIIASFRFTR